MLREMFFRRVGQKLAIVSASDPMTAADREVILNGYMAVHSTLTAFDLYPGAVEDEVRDDLADALIDATAAVLVDVFGIQEPRRSAIRAEGLLGTPVTSPAERRIRKVLCVPATDPPDNEYF
jgi:hypothetical protein